MRRIVVALIGAVLLVLAAAPTSWAAPRRLTVPGCAPRDSPAFLSDQHAQIYQDIGEVHACMRRGTRKVDLGYSRSVSSEVLAGDVVAYVETSLGGEQRIVVRSVATGGVLHNVSLRVAVVQETMLEGARAVQVVTNSHGAVAWVQEDSYGRHDGDTAPPTVYDVFALGPHGSQSLGVGLHAEPRSLKLSGNTLSWIEAGAPHSAALS